jgi:hypothetical protein
MPSSTFLASREVLDGMPQQDDHDIHRMVA